MKKFKKIIIIALAVIVIVAISALAIYRGLVSKENKQAIQKTEAIFASLKSEDKNAKNEYLDYQKMLNEEDDNESRDTLNALFNNLEYRIVKTKVNLKQAEITIEVSNKDAGVIFTNYMTKAIQLAFSSAFSSNSNTNNFEQELEQYLQEQASSDQIETITSTITLKMEKQGKEWKVVSDKTEFANAVLPGLNDKVKNMQESMNNINNMN